MSLNFKYFTSAESESFKFIMIPTLLFTDPTFASLSNDAKILYSLMLDRMKRSRVNKWIDKNNRVYIVFTVAEASKILNCQSGKITRIFRELDDENGIGLITRIKKGQGNPAIIYVKNFIQSENQESPESEVKNVDDDCSGIATIENQERSKSSSNHTKENNTDFNHTDHQSNQTDDRHKIEEDINSNLNITTLLSDHPELKATINSIRNRMIDVITGDRIIKIKGRTISTADAKSEYMKLSSDDILRVIAEVSARKNEIKDLDSYICAALYNAGQYQISFTDLPVNGKLISNRPSFDLQALMDHAIHTTPRLSGQTV